MFPRNARDRRLVDPLQTEQPGGGIADATGSRSIYTDQDGEDIIRASLVQ